MVANQFWRLRELYVVLANSLKDKLENHYSLAGAVHKNMHFFVPADLIE